MEESVELELMTCDGVRELYGWGDSGEELLEVGLFVGWPEFMGWTLEGEVFDRRRDDAMSMGLGVICLSPCFDRSHRQQ